MNFALAINLLLTLPAAAPGGLITPDPGTKAFRIVLSVDGLSPLSDFDELMKDRTSRLLIVLGDPAKATQILGGDGLNEFLRDGGAALIATDHDTKSLTADALGVWVDGTILSAPNPESCYRGQLNCPLLKWPDIPASRFGSITKPELEGVATNRPSYLHVPHPNPTRRTLALLPRGCANGEFVLSERPTRFAVAGELGHGRYIVMADHSLFINTMMIQGDNKNFALAGATINWLTENGRRTQALLVDDGIIRTNFDLNPARIDDRLPHPDLLMPAIDHMIIDLESDDAINRAIRRYVVPSQILRVFLLLLTVAVAMWSLYRITAARLRFSASAERLPDRVESLADPATASERRLRDRSQGNVEPLAQELARQFFDDQGIDTSIGDEPPAAVASNMLVRRHWRRQIAWLWTIARGQCAAPWPAEQLPRLVRELEAAQSAITTGQIQIRSAEHPV